MQQAFPKYKVKVQLSFIKVWLVKFLPNRNVLIPCTDDLLSTVSLFFKFKFDQSIRLSSKCNFKYLTVSSSIIGTFCQKFNSFPQTLLGVNSNPGFIYTFFHVFMSVDAVAKIKLCEYQKYFPRNFQEIRAHGTKKRALNFRVFTFTIRLATEHNH